MVKKTLVLILSIFFSSYGLCQKSQDSIRKAVIDYYKNEADDFFLLERYCTGLYHFNAPSTKKCDTNNIALYAFWKKNGKTFYRKIDCDNTPVIQIQSNVFDFYCLNSKDIFSEKVRPYKVGNSILSTSHSCFISLRTINNSLLATNAFDLFDLTSSDDHPNNNYQHNSCLKIVLLYKMCEDIISRN